MASATDAPKKPNRTGRAFTVWLDETTAKELDEFMASLEFETKYREHFQKAMAEYLAARRRKTGGHK